MKAIITFTSGLESSASEKTMSLSVRLGHDGDKGGTPVLEPGTTTTLDAGSNATAEIVLKGVDTEGNPKYKVNFGIPKGAKGDMPTPVQAVSSSTTDVPSCKAVTDAKELLFRDMWNSACGADGTYNATTGYYELNGLTDITYEQALNIYNLGYFIYQQGGYSIGGTSYPSGTVRTNLPTINGEIFAVGVNLSMLYMDYVKMEICNMGPKLRPVPTIYATSITHIFTRCYELKKVIGILNLQGLSTISNPFYQCYKLTDVNLLNLKANINLMYSPLLSYDSVKYMVDNAANTTAIVITVHATTLSYLNGTASDYTSTGHTMAEWQAIVTSATTKNITFAS